MNQPSYITAQACHRTRESGTVLVLFALLMVGIFGMLGALLDGGRLRVTRQQMDAGAECGALEGLRFKDVEGDAARRTRAARAVENLFDDDLDAANGDAMGLGAGTMPVVYDDNPFQGTIDVPTARADRAWKPAKALAMNDSNEVHGDLVAGTHIAEGAAGEDDSFTRGDFAPTAPRSGPADLAGSPAFLVRLRRASDRLDLDRDGGASSAGPPFEWLWARGAIWHEPTPGQSNLSRADGLTLRATSIAASARALYVSSDPVRGTFVANFALRVDAGSLWETTAPSATINLEVQPDGLLTRAGQEEGAAIASSARLVGAAIAPSLATWSAPPASDLIVPVYAPIDGVRQVVGFARGRATLAGSTLSVTRLPGALLPTGASNTSPAALDSRIALEMNPAARDLYFTFQHPVMAPVLRR